MKKVLLMASAFVLIPSAAYAIPGNQGGGQGGCGVGQQTNGCGDEGTDPSNPIPSVINNLDINSRVSNNVANMNNVRNDVNNTNVNANNVRNDNTNVNANFNQNTNRNVNNNQSSAVSESSVASENTNVINVDGDSIRYRFPASTAYAPALTSGIDTCMGSSSAGAQGIGFGLSFGSSWNDKNCIRLKNARQLSSMGYNEAATQLMCSNREVREAMKVAGTPCESIRR